MAYLDLRLADAVGAGTAAPAPAGFATGLRRPERDAILLSLVQSRTAFALGRASRLFGRMWLKADVEPVFADERIEAARRYAVRYRLEGGGLAFHEEERLAAVGVSQLAAAEIRALVDRHGARARPARQPSRIAARLLTALLLVVVPAATAAGLYFWLASQVEDRLSALIVSIVLVVGITSPLALAGRPAGRGA